MKIKIKEFEAVIKHWSDRYEEDCNCSICEQVEYIFEKYDFFLPKKYWDYDD